MSTRAEIAATKAITGKVCLNCLHSQTKVSKKKAILKCTLSGRAVNPNLIGCTYWIKHYA